MYTAISPAENMVCWISVQYVHVTVYLLQPVNAVPVMYLSSLRSMHNLLFLCSVMYLY